MDSFLFAVPLLVIVLPGVANSCFSCLISRLHIGFLWISSSHSGGFPWFPLF